MAITFDHEPKRKPRRSRRGQARQPAYGAEGSPNWWRRSSDRKVGVLHTLEYVNELKAADVPEKQATAQAKALRGVLAATVADQASAFATKADLRELELRLLSAISASENKVTTRLGAMLAVAVGVLLAVLPMLMRK